MVWKLYQTSSGTASLEDSGLEPDSVPGVLRALRGHFGERLQTGSAFGLGLDGAAGDILLDGVTLIVGWDIWSGLYIMAKDGRGDPLVREIAEIFQREQEESP